MEIRKANKSDYQQIAPLLLLAMEDIVYRFIGKESKESAIQFLEDLIKQPNNQYSYENCWIMIENKQITATACVYNGKNLHQLRQPVATYIQHHFHTQSQPPTNHNQIYLINITPPLP